MDVLKSILEYIDEPVEDNIKYIDNLHRVEVTKSLSENDGYSLKPSSIILFVKSAELGTIPINITNRFRKRYPRFSKKRLEAAKQTMPGYIHIHIAKTNYTVWQEDLNKWFVDIEEKAYKKLSKPLQLSLF